ncbi:MAG: alpha-N-arabinofuranosidase, partial [Ramlibacter sp.]|nr:alpha-N-arabinofuranosidase [Ramlibacter sp.]
FALNRDLEQPMALEVGLAGLGSPVIAGAQQLCDPDLDAANTRDEPERVTPQPLRDVAMSAGRFRATLAPASWNVIRLSPPPGRSPAAGPLPDARAR